MIFVFTVCVVRKQSFFSLHVMFHSFACIWFISTSSFVVPMTIETFCPWFCGLITWLDVKKSQEEQVWFQYVSSKCSAGGKHREHDVNVQCGAVGMVFITILWLNV